MIERYTMGVSRQITIGTAEEFEMERWTMRRFFPDERRTNALCPGFVVINDIIVDGIDIMYLDDIDAVYRSEHIVAEDAFVSAKEHVKFKPVECDHGVLVRAAYTGLIPDTPGIKKGDRFKFVLSLSGNVLLGAKD